MSEELKSETTIWSKNFIIITLINFLIFFSFQMLIAPFSIYIKNLGGADSIIGLVTGVLTVSAVIARPTTGIILDKRGRRNVFLIGLALFILAIFLYSWTSAIAILLLFRLIHGFGWGVSGTAASTIATDNLPRKRFGEGMGYFSLAASLAMAIGPAVGLTMVAESSFNILFYVSAGIGLIALLLSLTIKYDKSGVQEPAKAAAKISISASAQAPAEASVRSSLFEKTAYKPTLIIFFVTITYGTITSFLALYAAEKGINNIGIFFAVFASSLLASRPVFGRIVDKHGFNLATIPGLLCILVGVFLLSQAQSLMMFILVAVIYGIGFGAAQASLQTMAVINAPKHRLGAANATFFTGFDSGIGLGAVIMGAVASAVGYSQMYLWTIAAIVIAFVLFLTLPNKEPVRGAEGSN